ncbi:hypothetical protein HUA74_44030 [Myxococcus sp. CA051A]|uniref:hypothetical protein n=1 Tax=Myxococcus sp. CA051A TaxID=2741739 RepID=UPI00157B2066|nr:hypothetical protein [Myxococcus sp. CA051A]NTX67639.1 hypothetical protein [Myxococcus sp. CA051A]
MRRQQPGRQRSPYELPEDLRQLLARLARLRVVTGPQAYWLHEPFRTISTAPTRVAPTNRARSERAALARLNTLVKHGYLAREPENPSLGARTRSVYRLRNAGVTAAGEAGNTYLLQRPPPEVLKYLLLRNDVYAAARAAGWRIASTVLSPAHERRYLELHGVWTALRMRKAYEALQRGGAGPAALQAAADDIRQLRATLPTALTWEYLYRQDSTGAPVEVVLLVVDDPRRSVPAQLAQLPGIGLEDAGLLLRDIGSTYDLSTGLVTESERIGRWRKLLAARFPPARYPRLVSTLSVLPAIWANYFGTTAAPQLSRPLPQNESLSVTG